MRVARTDQDLKSGRNLAWDSGRVTSDESIHRVYAGAPLASGQRYVWQVQVWDDRGRASGWSAPAWWEMGLLAPSDWHAQWIEPGLPEDTATSPPAPMLRREFRLEKPVRSARAYVTSHGLYEMHLNGKRVGDDVLTPGWTSYNKRLQYQTYDVTPLLQRGDNAVGVMLGNGWYRGNIGFSKQRNIYGERLGAAAADRRDVHGRHARVDHERRAVEGGDRADPHVGDLPRRDLRRAAREAGLGRAGFRRPGVDGRPRCGVPEGHPHRARRSARAAHRGDHAEGDPDHAGRRAGRRHGTEHGRLGAPARRRARGHHRHAAPRRGARQGRELLHGQPAHGAADDDLHAEGRRRGDLRAALHLPGLPLRAGRRLSRPAHAREPHRHRRALRDGRDRRVRHVARAAEPAAAQHPVGAEGQLRRRADRLSAARRAARLDG